MKIYGIKFIEENKEIYVGSKEQRETLLEYHLKHNPKVKLTRIQKEMEGGKIRFNYKLIKQSTKKSEYDEWVEHEGSYHECLKQMPKIEKGYMIRILDETVDDGFEIVRTKGWDK